MKLRESDLEKEFGFATSRSSGPGGQNVNKVETRVEVSLNVNESEALTTAQKNLLWEKLGSRISKDGVLKLAVDETRSQLKNKGIAIDRMFDLLEKSLKRPKRRIATKPSKGSKARRVKAKKEHSEKKERRKKI